MKNNTLILLKDPETNNWLVVRYNNDFFGIKYNPESSFNRKYIKWWLIELITEIINNDSSYYTYSLSDAEASKLKTALFRKDQFIDEWDTYKIEPNSSIWCNWKDLFTLFL